MWHSIVRRSDHSRTWRRGAGGPRDRVVEPEGEIPCDGEAVGYPLAREPSDDVICDSRLLTHRALPVVDANNGIPIKQHSYQNGHGGTPPTVPTESPTRSHC